MVLQLLRGGFRTITGLIAKGSPEAAKVQTSTATIGIRGRYFDGPLVRPGLQGRVRQDSGCSQPQCHPGQRQAGGGAG